MDGGENKVCSVTYLVYGLPIGVRVWWKTILEVRYEGTLIEWDNGTAIVKMDDGSIKTVRSE